MRSAGAAVTALTLLIAVSAASRAAPDKIPSPDNRLYAVSEKGQKIGEGEEIERFSIFTAGDKPVSVLHIWSTEPNGTARIGMRGCESSGWIDAARFFCEGSGNPSLGVYRWFDARSGKELGEAIGTGFAWSPDRRLLANFGNVAHFTPDDSKSDSIEAAGHAWPPAADREQHWFRSELSWSPESGFVAVVDHQRRIRKAFYLEMLDCRTGKVIEHKLRWPDELDEWVPDRDFEVRWTADQVSVRRGKDVQSFPR